MSQLIFYACQPHFKMFDLLLIHLYLPRPCRII
jgi:hypothetical protein